MINIFKCNVCVMKRCTKWVSKKTAYDQYENIPLIDDARRCTSYQKDQGLKMPLLLHLMADDRKTDGANAILSMYKLRVIEESHYPFFKLLVNKR